MGALAGIIGLMALGAAATQASANPLTEPSVVVRYSNQDLSTTAGAETLYERIQFAAAQLCPEVSSAELARYRVFLRCRDEVVARAVASIRNPQLAAVYAAHHNGHDSV